MGQRSAGDLPEAGGAAGWGFGSGTPAAGAGTGGARVADGLPPDYAVKGARPLRTEQPRDAEAVAALLAEGAPALVRGGGTQDGLGGAVRSVAVLCDTTALIGPPAHAPEDLTVTVPAGMRWGELQAALAPHGQWVPCDPPLAERATVGGVVAGNAFGPWRQSQGGMRDLLIGLRAVSGGGTVFRSGARVAKNVAGFDLGKLLVGSAGTLAVLVECSFKVRPLPPCRRTFSVRGDPLRALGGAQPPAALAGWGGGDRLLIAYEGRAAAVDAAGAALREMYPEVDEAPATAWDEVRAHMAAGPLLVRASAPLAAAPDAARALAAADFEVLTLPGLGMAFARHADEATAAAAWERAVAIARAAGGRAICAVAPPGVADPWQTGDDEALVPLFRALKRRFDPRGALAAGRFVAGI